jgi:hypothetical protein
MDNNPHHPDLYGAVTQEAVSRAIILNNQNMRPLQKVTQLGFVFSSQFFLV